MVAIIIPIIARNSNTLSPQFRNELLKLKGNTMYTKYTAANATIFKTILVTFRNQSGRYNNIKKFPIIATTIERFIIHKTSFKALVTKYTFQLSKLLTIYNKIKLTIIVPTYSPFRSILRFRSK